VNQEMWAGLWDTLGATSITRTQLIQSLVVIAIVWALHYATLKTVRRRVMDVTRRYRWQKGIRYAAAGLTTLLLVQVWLQGVRNVVTYLGLLSAGLAIALQGLIVNLAGWVFILSRRPLKLGDRIQIGEHIGDVVDLRPFQFSLLEVGHWVGAEQSTGRIIHVPNGRVFDEPLCNYTGGFHYIWLELPVLITFESDWEKAKRLFERVLEEAVGDVSEAAAKGAAEASRRYLITYTRFTPTVYTSVLDSGVLLTLRFLAEPRRRRDTEEAVWERVLRVLAEHDDIDLAYPTYRLYSLPTPGQ